MQQATPFRIQRFLRGLHYPAEKKEVLAHARAQGADDTVLRALQTLDEGTYESPTSLSSAIGQDP